MAHDRKIPHQLTVSRVIRIVLAGLIIIPSILPVLGYHPRIKFLTAILFSGTSLDTVHRLQDFQIGVPNTLDTVSRIWDTISY